MFAKLLKHELRASGRILVPLGIAVLASCALGFFLSLISSLNINIESNVIFEIISIPIFISIFVSLFAYLIASFYVPCSHFYKNKFTDQGYLTFTLPVTTHQIIFSSILNLVISVAVSIVVLTAGLIMLLATETNAIRNMLDTLTFLTHQIGFWDILYFISNLLYAIIFPFLAITLGCTFAKKRKVGSSILFGYLISMGISVITTILLVVTTILNHSLGTSNFENISMIIYIIIYILAAVLGYFAIYRMMQKKLNI